MTGDTHVRLYASSRRQSLAALSEILTLTPGPVESKCREAAYYCRNWRVARQLVAKGFDKKRPIFIKNAYRIVRQ